MLTCLQFLRCLFGNGFCHLEAEGFSGPDIYETRRCFMIILQKLKKWQPNSRTALLPTALLFSVLLLKALLISRVLYGFPLSHETALLLRNDLQLLGFVLLLGLISALPHQSFKILSRLTGSLACGWYFIDTAVTIGLNARVGIVELLQYTGELAETRDGMLLGFSALALFLLLCCSRIALIRVSHPEFLLLAALLCFFMPRDESHEELRLFATPVRFDIRQIRGSEQECFPRSPTLAQTGPATATSIASRNIVLLVVESMSAVDSYRTSGLGDKLKNVDRIADEGLLFENYLANHVNTEGAFISLLTGVPPLQYPGADWNLYRSFKKLPSQLRTPAYQGYYSLFLAGSRLQFRGMDKFFSAMGFAEVVDAARVPAFQAYLNRPFGIVPDKVLYSAALERIAGLLQENKRFLFMIESEASHMPYMDDAGRSSSSSEVWSRADQDVAAFYNALRNTGFFEDGIMLITGDHRKMEPIAPSEYEKYGPTAPYRVPLIVVGRGMPAGEVDQRLLQQSDLLRFLPELPLRTELSTSSVLVKLYRKPLFGDDWAETILVQQNAQLALNTFPIRYLGRYVSAEHDTAPPVREFTILLRTLQTLAGVNPEICR